MNPASPPGRLVIRPSTDDDVAAMAGIYEHAVLHGTGTFELEVPSVADMRQRRAAVLASQWPWLVAERDGLVVGYAYANDFRPRRAYRFCVEDSIYIAPSAKGAGVGKTLLLELLSRCEARGARQMLAVIGDAANASSIGVHRSCGFEVCGLFKSAGRKFDRWLDVVLMQRALGPGAATPPDDRLRP